MNNLTPIKSNLTPSDATDPTELPQVHEATPEATADPIDEAGAKRLDRRGLLQFGGAAALAGTAAALLSTKAAAAATPGVMHFGATNGAGTLNTVLASSNTKSTLNVTNAGLGHGIVADATNANARGCGVLGTAVNGAGVAGGTRGDGPGMRAYAEPGAGGSAIEALTLEGNSASPTISAHSIGTGHGVYSHIENASNASRAVYGRTIGVGHAVMGSILNAQSSVAATKSTTQGSGAGLEALSAKGVGGRFEGKTAQVQLVPSSESSHPSSGASGQLFVDSGNRLWFCRGGSSWQQLA